MVKAEGCGVRLDSNVSDGIATVIQRLLDDSAQLKVFKERARQLAESDYSRVNTKRYIEILERI